MAGSELTFVWSGSDKTGRTVNGEINAPSVAIAKAQLRRQGFNAKRVKKKPEPLFSYGKNIIPADISVFTRQLATMTRAGVPMVQSMDIVMEGTAKIGLSNDGPSPYIDAVDTMLFGGDKTKGKPHAGGCECSGCSPHFEGIRSGVLAARKAKQAAAKQETPAR